MKPLLSVSLAAVAAVFLFSSLVSCGPTEDPKVPVSSVSVNPGSLNLEIGGTAVLTATVTPSDATDKTVTWSTSNPSVASVNNGSVTAVAEGSATITATAGGKSGTCQVTVNPKPEALVLVVGDVATVPAAGATVEVDVQYNVDYTVEVEAGAQSWIHYLETRVVQSGKLVFKVDANDGDKRSGKVTIKDNAGKVDPVTITIVQEKKIEVESVTLDRESAEIETGKTLQLTATVVPENAMDKTVTWSSDNETVATVDENGLVTGVAEGTATITAKAGEKTGICIVTVKENTLAKAKKLLEPFYEALDGQNWTDPWIPGENWPGLEYDGLKDKVSLYFNGLGLKGTIPECIGDLGDIIYRFIVYNEPGLTGTLPDSFRKLVALEDCRLCGTSMTSLPDVFGDMNKLQIIEINNNEQMGGIIPQSIGDSPVLQILYIDRNLFTGELQASWARLGVGNFNCVYNCMTGKIPSTFLELDEAQAGLRNMLWQREGYGFDITDIEIHGYECWPLSTNSTSATIEDLYGNLFSFDDVIGKNKYTVYISWAPWCPFSQELMPQLRDYYNIYRNDGLEVIATVMLTDSGQVWKDNEAQKKAIEESGYDKWYNFSWWDAGKHSYLPFTPAAEVYDSNGYILFSSMSKYYDPVRKRFDRVASTELIPFLESLLGPAEEPDTYESNDYSKDGEVLTLQKASVGKGIDIVFMGDGYVDKDMGKDGLYETLMNQMMEEFFAIEPYKTFRDRFNVYAVKVVSPNAKIGSGYSTSLQTAFGNGSEVWGDYDKVGRYVELIPSISSMDDVSVAVLVNTRRHAGMTQLSSSTQSGIAFLSSNGNDKDLFGSTLRHETGGHAFAFLADEYAEYRQAAPESHINYYNEVYNQYGWFSNVDFTDDPSTIRWSAFLSDNRYKDEVGIFEGGALYMTGAYRPSENSMMNMNFEYFNAPSRWAIYQRIMKLSGEDYSFEKFLEYDAVNRGAAAAAAARPPLKAPAAPQRNAKHTAPPKIVP